MSNHVNGLKPVFPENAASKDYAAYLDAADSLAAFRHKFIVPSKANIASKKLAKPSMFHDRARCDSDPYLTSHIPELSSDPCIYFCGNSLGIQPKAVSRYLEAQLNTWSSIGVNGHFTKIEDSPLEPWQLLADQAASSMCKLVGAAPEEVTAMATLTANLHMLMASFYKPTATKHKVLLDWKAFPSDHVCYATFPSPCSTYVK